MGEFLKLLRNWNASCYLAQKKEQKLIISFLKLQEISDTNILNEVQNRRTVDQQMFSIKWLEIESSIKHYHVRYT